MSSENSNDTLTKLVNDSFLNSRKFPSNLKLADITPTYKKNDPLAKENYRPVSVLPVVSKIFERLMQQQINSYISEYLSDFLCGYRQGFSTQHALIKLIESWRKCLDNKGYSGAVLMDLSKAFDTINHELLIAKLHAYGFSRESLELILDYLSNRWQRTKICGNFSSWAELLQGVPQGSVLGPLLFNIYINDLFYLTEMTDVCNFADDTTFFACDSNLKDLMQRLEHDTKLAIEWFESNYMKLNEDKCHLLVAGHRYETLWADIGNTRIWESKSEKLLGVVIDRNLNFDDYVFTLCKKAGRKLSALSRISYYMSFEKKRILLKAFIESQFGYCPLTWMFHSRKANHKINHIHERALRIVYEDHESSFENLLKKDNSVCIHHKNIQSLAIELFKVKNNLSNTIMGDIFETRNINYNLRSQTDFARVNVNTTSFGLNSLRYLASKIWDIVPNDIKLAESLDLFKEKIRKWEPNGFHCKLCKTYIHGVGFIDTF